MTREPSPLFLGSLPLFPSPPPLAGSPPVPCPGSSTRRQPGSCNTLAQRGRHPWQSHTAICAGRVPPGEQLAGFTGRGVAGRRPVETGHQETGPGDVVPRSWRALRREMPKPQAHLCQERETLRQESWEAPCVTLSHSLHLMGLSFAL